jgi:two-component system, sensor histidine kinase and response regulator
VSPMDNNFNILIVDDDQVDRMAVRRALKASNIKMQLSEAENYASAVTTLKSQSFDCIFVDYLLPDKNGLALVRDLRQNGLTAPLVILTGQSDTQIAVDLMKAGATDYLPKSKISPEVLEQVLRSVVRIHQAEMEAELAKQQREHLVRQREDFLYRLTHDLRTPLVAADRMMILVKQQAFGSISLELNEAIDTMIRSNQNLLQMVNTILEVYRHDAGQKALSFAPYEMCALIEDVIQELMPLADEKGLVLRANCHEIRDRPAQTTIIGDRLELRRVLTNIIGNAIKFTDMGSVSIHLQDPSLEAHESADWLTIQVQDTGAGIPEADQIYLFDRFRQGENKRSGSGLGLYLSHRIVTGHNGTIQVKSALGKGSTFTIQLPRNPLANPVSGH